VSNYLWQAASTNAATPYDFTTFTTTNASTTANVGYFNGTAGNVVYLPQLNLAPAKPDKPEDPVAWLKRRVTEVMWVPAA
jgi:hypothetical protein